MRGVFFERGPQRCTHTGRVFWIGPAEHGTAPILHRNAQVLSIPVAERLGILCLEEDAADSGYAFHVGLQQNGFSALGLKHHAYGCPKAMVETRRDHEL